MSWYRRQLAEGQTFRCSSCGRIKRVKYVPTSNLYRSCAAKNGVLGSVILDEGDIT